MFTVIRYIRLLDPVAHAYRYGQRWSQQRMLIRQLVSDLKVQFIELQGEFIRPRSNSRRSPVVFILHLKFPPV